MRLLRWIGLLVLGSASVVFIPGWLWANQIVSAGGIAHLPDPLGRDIVVQVYATPTTIPTATATPKRQPKRTAAEAIAAVRSRFLVPPPPLKPVLTLPTFAGDGTWLVNMQFSQAGDGKDQSTWWATWRFYEESGQAVPANDVAANMEAMNHAANAQYAREEAARLAAQYAPTPAPPVFLPPPVILDSPPPPTSCMSNTIGGTLFTNCY